MLNDILTGFLICAVGFVLGAIVIHLYGGRVDAAVLAEVQRIKAHVTAEIEKVLKRLEGPRS